MTAPLAKPESGSRLLVRRRYYIGCDIANPRGRAATELGVTRQGLTKLMTRLGIADPSNPNNNVAVD